MKLCDLGLSGIHKCPFCGDYPNLEQDIDLTWSVSCNNKECYVAPITKAFKLKIDAVRAWNIRDKSKPVFKIVGNQ